MKEPNTKGLTEKQKIFCREYIYDWNATRAAIKAGYSEKTAYSIGSENLSKPEIQAYLKEIQANLAEVAGISRLRIVEEHKKIINMSIAHLHNSWIERKEFDKLTDEQKSCIAEIQTQTRIEMKYDPIEEDQVPIQVDFVKIKLYDKQKAIDSLTKMMGWNEPDKVEHSGGVITGFKIAAASGKRATGK